MGKGTETPLRLVEVVYYSSLRKAVQRTEGSMLGLKKIQPKSLLQSLASVTDQMFH